MIEEKSLQHWIDNFYGYGSWRARFWFVAHEEGGGELPEEVSEKLDYFKMMHAQRDGVLCDIRELYKRVVVRWESPKANLFQNLYEYRFGKNAVQHGIWKNLIAFACGYRHEEIPELLPHQQQNFLSPEARKEALIRLYPLPAPHSHAWYYNWLDLPEHPFLKSRTLYQEQLYERRIHTILLNMRACKPEVVLMYGMENINRLKKSVQEFFDGAKFKMIKATTRQIPQHHRIDISGTTMLITTQIPALRHNRIETGFDWEEFGKRVKG